MHDRLAEARPHGGKACRFSGVFGLHRKAGALVERCLDGARCIGEPLQPEIGVALRGGSRSGRAFSAAAKRTASSASRGSSISIRPSSADLPGPDQVLPAAATRGTISAGLPKDSISNRCCSRPWRPPPGAGDQALGKIFTIGYILAGIGIFVPARDALSHRPRCAANRSLASDPPYPQPSKGA